MDSRAWLSGAPDTSGLIRKKLAQPTRPKVPTYYDLSPDALGAILGVTLGIILAAAIITILKP